MNIVAADIGGTNARFAIAEIVDGRVASLSRETVLKTASYANLQSAWETFSAQIGHPLPRAAAIAVAAPVQDDVLKLTNNPWTIQVSALWAQLGLDRVAVLNDFEAIGHAVAQLDQAQFSTLCGPDSGLPEAGVISVIGPGTGLGVAQVLRRPGGYDVVSTEGGHVGFAPSDEVEDAILSRLRQRFPHISAERIVSGPGLIHIYEGLAALEGQPAQIGDDKALWASALAGRDSLAAAALERFCLCLGAYAGDIALAQGAAGVVIAGGLGQRIADVLARSGFGQRFAAKGRFTSMMAAIPVKLINHKQPGLYGAAAAFARALSA